MDEEEINKVIAEFMGWRKLSQNIHYQEKTNVWYGVEPDSEFEEVTDVRYTESLDALLPCMKKLDLSVTLDFEDDIDHVLNLAAACAGIIKEINESKPH